jgi:hypothetical protein
VIALALVTGVLALTGPAHADPTILAARSGDDHDDERRRPQQQRWRSRTATHDPGVVFNSALGSSDHNHVFGKIIAAINHSRSGPGSG